MGLGAAVLGAGALGLAGSGISAYGAMNASKEQQQTAQEALGLQGSMFNTARGALSPYYTAGAKALPTLSALLNPGSSAATLESLPGFQFQSMWGGQQAKNALSAEGLGGSAGPLGKALSDYNQGLAGTYWTNAVSGLQGEANMGAGAASALAGNALGFGQTMGNTLGSLGSAQASGTLGVSNALAGGLGGLGNTALIGSILGNGGAGFGGVNNSGGLYGSFNAPNMYSTMPNSYSQF